MRSAWLGRVGWALYSTCGQAGEIDRERERPIGETTFGLDRIVQQGPGGRHDPSGSFVVVVSSKSDAVPGAPATGKLRSVQEVDLSW